MGEGEAYIYGLCAEILRLRKALTEIANRAHEAPMEDLIDAGRIAREALRHGT